MSEPGWQEEDRIQQALDVVLDNCFDLIIKELMTTKPKARERFIDKCREAFCVDCGYEYRANSLGCSCSRDD